MCVCVCACACVKFPRNKEIPNIYTETFSIKNYKAFLLH